MRRSHVPPYRARTPEFSTGVSPNVDVPAMGVPSTWADGPGQAVTCAFPVVGAAAAGGATWCTCPCSRSRLLGTGNAWPRPVRDRGDQVDDFDGSAGNDVDVDDGVVPSASAASR